MPAVVKDVQLKIPHHKTCKSIELYSTLKGKDLMKYKCHHFDNWWSFGGVHFTNRGSLEHRDVNLVSDVTKLKLGSSILVRNH